MTRKPTAPDELAAAEIVRAVTRCNAEPLDPGGGREQLADFTLLNGTGAVLGLLEVTSITDSPTARFASRVSSKHRSWEDSQLGSLWYISVASASTRLRGLRDIVTPYLVELERDSYSHASANPRQYRIPVRQLPQSLLEAGIVEVIALRKVEPGVCFINTMPRSISYGINSLTSPIEAVANKDDNRAKLKGAAPRRELFVWVNPPSVAASVLATYSDDPWRKEVHNVAPPALPGEITAVWAALWPRDPVTELALALWRGDMNGWEVLEPPKHVP